MRITAQRVGLCEEAKQCSTLRCAYGATKLIESTDQVLVQIGAKSIQGVIGRSHNETISSICLEENANYLKKTVTERPEIKGFQCSAPDHEVIKLDFRVVKLFLGTP